MNAQPIVKFNAVNASLVDIRGGFYIILDCLFIYRAPRLFGCSVDSIDVSDGQNIRVIVDINESPASLIKSSVRQSCSLGEYIIITCVEASDEFFNAFVNSAFSVVPFWA